jgi:AraC-like DNA-binding protein
MRYREYPVPEAQGLHAVVEAIWTLESDGPSEPAATADPVIPDGRAEIIVHFGDPFDRLVDGGFDRQAPTLVVGQLTQAILLRPANCVSVLGIRLKPEGAVALWREPQHELTGRVVDPAALSQPLARWLSGLRDTYASAEAAAPHVAEGLSGLIALPRLDPRINTAVSVVLETHGGARIDDLAVRAGCTRRHLERLFLDQVGLTPKRLSRIRRFQRALATLEQAQAAGARSAGLTAATMCGYADQSHFVHEFRELAGTTPSSDLLQRAALTGLFIG